MLLNDNNFVLLLSKADTHQLRQIKLQVVYDWLVQGRIY